MSTWTPPPNWPAPEPGWTPPPGWQPAPEWGPAPTGWNFYPDNTPPPTVGPSAVKSPTGGQPWFRKRWVPIAAAGLVGLTVGAASAGGDTGPTPKQLADAEARAEEAEAARDEAQSDVVRAQKEASDAKAAALKDLKSEADKVAAAQKALDVREAKVSGLESEAKANEFEGEGLYLVGSDIKPGTYKADASVGCYFARLASTDTSDIIDNGNIDGPIVITVKASDKALQVQRCGTFRKVG